MTLPRDRRSPFVLALGVVAVAIAAYHAGALAWISDDAYISFRYARNLVHGLGLVYNAGERVEGYTNFLWTLWCALGLRLGFRPEPWANASSIACFVSTVALLAGLTWRRARDGALGFALPIAALTLALDRDACTFATSGLETSLFTLLLVAGFVALAGGRDTLAPRRAAAGGLLLALATLTRPDGGVFVALGAVYVLAMAHPRRKATLAYAAAGAALLVPYAVWKLSYYGALLPNTYYAKSAMIPWWDQGRVYAGLYFGRYPSLIVGPLLVLALAPFASRFGRGTAERGRAHPYAAAALATGFALVYTLCVMRAGGDFMFARLLIPVTPFCALAFELALGPLIADLTPVRWVPGLAAAAVALSLPFVGFAPPAFDPDGRVRGIVDERVTYENVDRAATIRHAEELRELTRGLPVRVAIGGAQAIAGYYSEIPVVIEASTGLTDAVVAHQELEHRGRVGHEKPASFHYLIEVRRVQLLVGRAADKDSLERYIPEVPLRYKATRATLLTWDPALVAEFRRRGAHIEDYLATLDRFIRGMPHATDTEVATTYAQAKRFYFEGVKDPAREAPFLRRLGEPNRLASAGVETGKARQQGT